MTCNSFRLLEVFNRHFKLRKEEACKKKREGRGREVRERKRKGSEISRGLYVVVFFKKNKRDAHRDSHAAIKRKYYRK